MKKTMTINALMMTAQLFATSALHGVSNHLSLAHDQKTNINMAILCAEMRQASERCEDQNSFSRKQLDQLAWGCDALVSGAFEETSQGRASLKNELQKMFIEGMFIRKELMSANNLDELMVAIINEYERLIGLDTYKDSCVGQPTMTNMVYGVSASIIAMVSVGYWVYRRVLHKVEVLEGTLNKELGSREPSVSSSRDDLSSQHSHPDPQFPGDLRRRPLAFPFHSGGSEPNRELFSRSNTPDSELSEQVERESRHRLRGGREQEPVLSPRELQLIQAVARSFSGPSRETSRPSTADISGRPVDASTPASSALFSEDEGDGSRTTARAAQPLKKPSVKKTGASKARKPPQSPAFHTRSHDEEGRGLFSEDDSEGERSAAEAGEANKRSKKKKSK